MSPTTGSECNLFSSATRYNLPGTHFRLAYVAMMERAERSFAQIEVIPARSEQEPILANLLELYAHGSGNPTCSRPERWPAVDTFLI
jgi:hypothetical protein